MSRTHLHSRLLLHLHDKRQFDNALHLKFIILLSLQHALFHANLNLKLKRILFIFSSFLLSHVPKNNRFQLKSNAIEVSQWQIAPFVITIHWY